jgi:hypothetical protein
MKFPLLNRTFFRFVFGFIGILFVSFVVLFVVNAVMYASPEHSAEATLPFSTCITSSGEPC